MNPCILPHILILASAWWNRRQVTSDKANLFLVLKWPISCFLRLQQSPFPTFLWYQTRSWWSPSAKAHPFQSSSCCAFDYALCTSIDFRFKLSYFSLSVAAIYACYLLFSFFFQHSFSERMVLTPWIFFLCNCHFLNTRDTAGRENLKRVVVSKMRAATLLTPITISRSIFRLTHFYSNLWNYCVASYEAKCYVYK